MFRRIGIFLMGWTAGLLIFLVRLTLRFNIVDDPRPALKEAGQRYIYAILHSQQINFVLVSDDVPVAAMVSASKDGDVLVPPCKVRNIIPCRGSTRKKGKDKGGRKALQVMADHVRSGIPALLAVDGPRGPRGTVHWGVVDLAIETESFIVIAGIQPNSRWILSKTWDRTQIPKPFTTMNGRFREPINPKDFPDRAALRAHVAAELHALELQWDPEEAKHNKGIPETQEASSQPEK